MKYKPKCDIDLWASSLDHVWLVGIVDLRRGISAISRPGSRR